MTESYIARAIPLMGSLLVCAPLSVGAAGPPDGLSVDVINPVEIDDRVPIQIEDVIRTNNLVSLRAPGVPCSNGRGESFIFSLPDGSPSGGREDRFVVPDGMVFVATSLQYSARLATRDEIVTINVRRVTPTTESNLALSAYEIANENGMAAGRQSMPDGIAFGPGIEPCIESSGDQTTLGVVRASMQGYLTTR